jgi:NADH dehydrogenase [ubiquinone] 1 alpha subcomplex assembly factor 7
MNDLAGRIASTIEREGPIDIARYMTLCLHDAAAGAYASRVPVGADGDFITAPEISQTFGEMCGLWVVQSWHNRGRPAKPLLVELGPGRGTMMRDLLGAARAAAGKHLTDLDVVLVEASPALAAVQKETLKNEAGISWVDNLAAVTPGRPTFFVANEFFDCLPIRQYVKTAEGWREKVVAVQNGALVMALAATALPEDGFDPAAPEGAVVEVCPAASALIGDIARLIAGGGGSALIFDYGYETPHFRDTLKAVERHRHADPLAAPGTSDLSADVDFGALKRAAEEAGAAVYGPREQGDLLIDLGIEVRTRRLMLANPKEAHTIFDGVKRLIDPAAMGTLFKALALGPRGASNPPGF